MLNDGNKIHSIFDVCSIDSKIDKEYTDELRDKLLYEQRSVLAPPTNTNADSDVKNYKTAKIGLIFSVISLVIFLSSIIFDKGWINAFALLTLPIGFICSQSADSNSLNKKTVRIALVGMLLSGVAFLLILFNLKMFK